MTDDEADHDYLCVKVAGRHSSLIAHFDALDSTVSANDPDRFDLATKDEGNKTSPKLMVAQRGSLCARFYALEGGEPWKGPDHYDLAEDDEGGESTRVAARRSSLVARFDALVVKSPERYGLEDDEEEKEHKQGTGGVRGEGAEAEIPPLPAKMTSRRSSLAERFDALDDAASLHAPKFDDLKTFEGYSHTSKNRLPVVARLPTPGRSSALTQNMSH